MHYSRTVGGFPSRGVSVQRGLCRSPYPAVPPPASRQTNNSENITFPCGQNQPLRWLTSRQKSFKILENVQQSISLRFFFFFNKTIEIALDFRAISSQHLLMWNVIDKLDRRSCPGIDYSVRQSWPYCTHVCLAGFARVWEYCFPSAWLTVPRIKNSRDLGGSHGDK